ncbi:MAG: MerR family transcriptional regulator [Proteobacteria bacterium]|nr:MerR family transcriptional regulator [Pseudomonadota bacterium]
MSNRLSPDQLPSELTLRSLVSETAQYVDRMGLVPADGRASKHPDARAIRYYVSLGLVDRPLGYRGNSALYGRRHLLQLLAIKALQASGTGLPDIQRMLLGRGDDWLASQLPELVHAPAPPPSIAPPPMEGGRWNLELNLAPGVRVTLEAGALVRLDPDGLADALRAALGNLAPTSVPNQEENA